MRTCSQSSDLWGCRAPRAGDLNPEHSLQVREGLAIRRGPLVDGVYDGRTVRGSCKGEDQPAQIVDVYASDHAVPGLGAGKVTVAEPGCDAPSGPVDPTAPQYLGLRVCLQHRPFKAEAVLAAGSFGASRGALIQGRETVLRLGQVVRRIDGSGRKVQVRRSPVEARSVTEHLPVRQDWQAPLSHDCGDTVQDQRTRPEGQGTGTCWVEIPKPLLADPLGVTG